MGAWGCCPLPGEVEGSGRCLTLITRLHLVLTLRRMELHIDSPISLHGTVVNYAQGELQCDSGNLYDKKHSFVTKGNEVSPTNETECAEHL